MGIPDSAMPMIPDTQGAGAVLILGAITGTTTVLLAFLYVGARARNDGQAWLFLAAIIIAIGSAVFVLVGAGSALAIGGIALKVAVAVWAGRAMRGGARRQVERVVLGAILVSAASAASMMFLAFVVLR
jgi:hypothetical protein